MSKIMRELYAEALKSREAQTAQPTSPATGKRYSVILGVEPAL